MKLNRKTLVIILLSLTALLMTASVALARDYVVPDEPFIIEYQGQQHYGRVNLSRDGRFVVISSMVDNHIYVHDRQLNTTERASVDNQGQPLAGSSGLLSVAISDDGRYVVFHNAPVPGYIYVRDRLTQQTKSIAYDPNGTPVLDVGGTTLSITGEGRFVVFWGRSPIETCENDAGCTSVYVYDQMTEKTELVSVNNSGIPADNANAYAVISNNGRYVAFISDATNLGGPSLICEEDEVQTMNCAHLYLHDRQNHTTRYIPLPDGRQNVLLWVEAILFGIDMSGNGRYIVYTHLAEGEGEQPFQTYVYDIATETTDIIRLGDTNTLDDLTYQLGMSVISDDGRFVLLGKKTEPYIYVHDRVLDETAVVTDENEQPIAANDPRDFSLIPKGFAISGDGETVAYTTYAWYGDADNGQFLAHGQTFSPAPYTEVELVKNGGAETGGVMTKMPQNWDITDYRAGRRRCDHFPNTDSCVFQIKPVKDKIARLTQSVPAVNNPGDTLNFSASVRGFNVSRATVRVLVNYADGTTEFVKIPSATLNGTYNYKQVTANLTLDKLAYSIKVQMYIHNRGTGKLLVDDVSLKLGSGEPEALDLISVPDAPIFDTLPGRTTN